MDLLRRLLRKLILEHNSQHLHFNARPQAQDLDKNFQAFLEDPDPRNKLIALIKMKGSLKDALDQLSLYETHRYINNIDAAKIRQEAENYRD